MDNFAHLHVHSQYSLLHSTAPVADLAQRAASDGLTCLALTDTNALYGAVAFAKACREAGIRPIIGMAASIALPGDLDARTNGEGQASGCLVLLATGPRGYRSLCKLSSLIQGHPDRQSRAAHGLDLDDLQAHHEGLVCLGGGRRGWVERLLRAGDGRAARRFAERLAGIYAENAYLSLELHGPGSLPLAQEIVSLGLPTVAVQPVYCLSPQDTPRLKLLAAIDLNCPLDAVPPAALPHGGDPDVAVHWLAPHEMAECFAAFPDALARVGEITARCKAALPSGETIWPRLDLPEGQSADEALAKLARAGLVERYAPAPPATASERLERELAVIARHGYAPLFLIVADVVRFARQTEIPVSTRGSVANSIVAYCTSITTVDPVAHDLLFERFLSPARSDPPDIDLDFCSRRRDEVLEYVRRTYGAERVALVATVSTMRPRSALREAAKARGLDEAQIKGLSTHLPRYWHPDPRRRDQRTITEAVGELDDPVLQNVVREADQLVGAPHHLSVHPGGVVITPGPMTDTLPVQWASKGFLVTQFDHHDVEALGLPKIDLLGISALTVLADAARLVRRDHEPGFRLADVPLDDPLTSEVLARGETVGVFQCESEGARSTLRKLKARTVRDLAVANAFFKPGPSTGGMARTFVRRYRGEEKVAYLHPALAPILGPTKGVLIFQEQILRVAREIAGLSWQQADHLRRGMSKFRGQEMAQTEIEFLHGCQRPPPEGPGFTPQQAQRLWEQVLPFSGYGFNQGHATAYADVSYRSAYLKTHWPAAFFCARLMNWGGYHHPAIYAAEAARLGIAIRPPHVNHSDRNFALAWEDEKALLWMGLRQVRDLRRSAVKSIVAERQRRPFADLRDLLGRVPLQPKELAHLIQCGGLDGLAESRAALLAEAKEIERAGSTLQMSFALGRPQTAPESLAQRIAWEKQLLGYPPSGLAEPLGSVAGRLPEFVPLRRLPEMAGHPVTVAGVRLSGWRGGNRFYLWDGETWIAVQIVIPEGKARPRPPSWEALLLRGRWVGDEWGMFRLQAKDIQEVLLLGPLQPGL